MGAQVVEVVVEEAMVRMLEALERSEGGLGRREEVALIEKNRTGRSMRNEGINFVRRETSTLEHRSKVRTSKSRYCINFDK